MVPRASSECEVRFIPVSYPQRPYSAKYLLPTFQQMEGSLIEILSCSLTHLAFFYVITKSIFMEFREIIRIKKCGKN